MQPWLSVTKRIPMKYVSDSSLMTIFWCTYFLLLSCSLCRFFPARKGRWDIGISCVAKAARTSTSVGFPCKLLALVFATPIYLILKHWISFCRFPFFLDPNTGVSLYESCKLVPVVQVNDIVMPKKLPLCCRKKAILRNSKIVSQSIARFRWIYRPTVNFTEVSPKFHIDITK